MSPQRSALRSAANRRSGPRTAAWRPRQLAAQRSTAPRECPKCGALVADHGRHRAWHDQAAARA